MSPRRWEITVNVEIEAVQHYQDTRTRDDYLSNARRQEATEINMMRNEERGARVIFWRSEERGTSSEQRVAKDGLRRSPGLYRGCMAALAHCVGPGVILSFRPVQLQEQESKGPTPHITLMSLPYKVP